MADGTRAEGGANARARAQAQPGRAAEAREEPARDARRAAGTDRDRVCRHRGGRPRPPQVVGRLPRQAEDRDVHAPDQAAGRADHARAVARDRRALERARPRRRRADDPADDPAALPRARLPADGVRPPARGRADDGRRLRRRRTEPDGLPGRGPRPRRALRRHRPARRGDGVLLRQSGLLRPAAQAQDLDLGVRRTAATRPRSTASRSSARSATASAGFAVLVGGGLSSVPRIARDLGRLDPRGRGDAGACARCSTPGRKTCATASPASRHG